MQTALSNTLLKAQSYQTKTSFTLLPGIAYEKTPREIIDEIKALLNQIASLNPALKPCDKELQPALKEQNAGRGQNAMVASLKEHFNQLFSLSVFSSLLIWRRQQDEPCNTTELACYAAVSLAAPLIVTGLHLFISAEKNRQNAKSDASQAGAVDATSTVGSPINAKP